MINSRAISCQRPVVAPRRQDGQATTSKQTNEARRDRDAIDRMRSSIRWHSEIIQKLFEDLDYWSRRALAAEEIVDHQNRVRIGMRDECDRLRCSDVAHRKHETVADEKLAAITEICDALKQTWEATPGETALGVFAAIDAIRSRLDQIDKNAARQATEGCRCDAMPQA